jgi:hypothetical protein
MHRRVFIKKTWLSAFCYSQSNISLVFCHFLGFLVPWSSSLTAESDLADFCVMYGEEGGWTSFVCLQKLQYISLTCLNGFLAKVNFDNIFC